jgi:hypothetical protein
MASSTSGRVPAGDVGGLTPHQRRLVGGRDNDNRASEPRFAEIILQQLLHLAAEFADLLSERLHGANRRRVVRATMVTPVMPILTLYLPGPLIIASSLGTGGLARPERRGESTESLTAET